MEEKINTKIKNLIQSSILLNKKQKEAIRKKLKNASLEEKQSLIVILESEKTRLKSIIENYLKENGNDGLNNLKRIISKTKKTVSQKKERIHKISEEEKMAKLLNNLEEDGN